MTTTNDKNISTLLHLSALTQYFIPLGNYIFPILIWSAKKNDSEFTDYNGKQIINFQLSMLLYSLTLCLIAIPIIIYTFLKNFTINDFSDNCEIIFNHFNSNNLTGTIVLAIVALVVLGFIKIIEFALIIYAAVKASNGEQYQYPLTINFLK
jgi:uncharacterized Tic20 family protein